MNQQVPKNLLVISASNGENLKLAKKFINQAKEKNHEASLIDLTLLDLALYNPRTQKEKGIPKEAIDLNNQFASATHWIMCAPEYNGSIPPVLTSAIAWLSVQGDDFRKLFNGRPIGLASFSGGGGMELLVSLRIQLSHLGAQVVGKQVMSNYKNPPKEESIEDLLSRLMQMKPLEIE